MSQFQGGGGSGGSGSGNVTNSGTLITNKVALGSGTTVVKVDSALATDGAGAISNAASLTVIAGGTVGSADTGTPKFTFGSSLITASQPVNAPSLSTGTAPTACGSATGCFGATAASTASTQTSGQGSVRLDTSVWKLRQTNGAAETQIATYADTLAVFGAGALASGTTATTQSASDNSTKVATTAYVDAAAGGGTTITYAQSTIILAAGFGAPAQNHCSVWPWYIPSNWSATGFIYDVQTADNTANAYDFALYYPTTGSGGYASATSVNLIAHTGSVAGTTILAGTGTRTQAFTGGVKTGSAGWYLFAMCSSAAAAAGKIWGDSNSFYYLPFNWAGAGDINVAAFPAPASLTSPTVGWTNISQIAIGIYK